MLNFQNVGVRGGELGVVRVNEHPLLAKSTLSKLTLARKPCFPTFAGVGGGVRPPPWRFQTKRRRVIFGPRSIFEPVMAGQRSNFRKFHDFSTSRVDSINTIYLSGMKPSPAYSPRSILHRMWCFDASRLNN